MTTNPTQPGAPEPSPDSPEVGGRTSAENLQYRLKVGARIDYLRNKRHLSVSDLARATGISRAHMHHLLKGDATMKFTTLKAVEKALGVKDLWAEEVEEVAAGELRHVAAAWRD